MEIKYWNQIRKSNIGINNKNLNLGLVPQPWIKTLDQIWKYGKSNIDT